MKPENVPGTLGFIQKVLETNFPGHDAGFVSELFVAVQKVFGGKTPGYQACDTAFHDFRHTCEGAEALLRILDGHIKGGESPKLTARDVELAAASIFLHDIGYLKDAGDRNGSGAKHTLTHVERSLDFAARFLPQFGVDDDEIGMVQRAIQCTGYGVEIRKLKFRDDRERFIGCALGTGDLIGQMAASDYPDRIPALYREYEEAAQYAGGPKSTIAGYSSAEEMMRKTRNFYEKYAKAMLEEQFGGVYRDLRHHYPDGKIHYLEEIETNLTRIDKMVAGK